MLEKTMDENTEIIKKCWKRHKEVIFLNVGGKLFVTTPCTLRQYGEHYFTRMLDFPDRFEEYYICDCNQTPIWYIDRNGELFSYVLDFLRHGHLYCPREKWLLQALMLEAKYYCIAALEREIQKMIQQVDFEQINQSAKFLEKIQSYLLQPSGDMQMASNRLPSDMKPQTAACGERFIAPHSLSQYASPSEYPNCLNTEYHLKNVSNTYSIDGSRRSSSVESFHRNAAVTSETTSPKLIGSQNETIPINIKFADTLPDNSEALRRAQINDDPDPPVMNNTQDLDLGDRIIETDLDF